MEGKALPPGISAINKACQALYPEQTDPRQVTALLKYWLGGPDPLDYITIYRSNGASPHWHYVSYGLSNLYGDKRSHTEIEGVSGFGFELTFRLLSDAEDPPSWPAELLQSLARYVFVSGSVLCAGDHVSWHSALDGGDSRLEHILLCEDPQLPSVSTPHGQLTFIQCVGVDVRELHAAQWWNCLGVLSLMAKHNTTGGPLLVTDMRRGKSLFSVDPSAQGIVDAGLASDGSLLSGVNALVSWSGAPLTSDPELPRLLDEVRVQLSREALLLIPIVIRGRLKHGRHFTFKSFTADEAVTLVVEGVEGALTRESSPMVASGPWLHLLLTARQVEDLESGVRDLLEARLDVFELCEPHLQLSILQEP